MPNCLASSSPSRVADAAAQSKGVELLLRRSPFAVLPIMSETSHRRVDGRARVAVNSTAIASIRCAVTVCVVGHLLACRSPREAPHQDLSAKEAPAGDPINAHAGSNAPPPAPTLRTQILSSGPPIVERVIKSGEVNGLQLGEGTVVISVDPLRSNAVAVTKDAMNVGALRLDSNSLLWFWDGKLRTAKQPHAPPNTIDLLSAYNDFDAQLRTLPVSSAPDRPNDETERYASRNFCGYDGDAPEVAVSRPLQVVWHNLLQEVSTLQREPHPDVAWQSSTETSPPATGSAATVGGASILVLLKAVTGPGFELPALTVLVAPSDAARYESTHIVLASEATFGSLKLPRGARLSLYPQEHDAVLATASFESTWLVDDLCVAPRSWVLFGNDGRIEDFVSNCDLDFMESTIPAFSQIATSKARVPAIARLSRPTPLFGLEATPGTKTCFEDNGALRSLLLNSDTSIAGVLWPAGTRISMRGPQWYQEALPVASVTWRGMTSIPGHPIELSARGEPTRIRILGQAELDGLKCADVVQFFDNGKFRGCVLAANAVLAGVALRPGWAEVTPTGHLGAGTLDQTYSLGSSTYHPGDTFTGIFQEKVLQPVRTAPEVQAMLDKLSGKVDEAVRNLLIKRAGKTPFGNFNASQIVLTKDERSIAERSFTTTRTYHIENLVTNWPFNDCDSDVTLTADVQWEITPWHELRASAGLKPGSAIIVDPKSACPVGHVLLTIAAIFEKAIDAPRVQQMQKELSIPVDTATALLVQKLTGSFPILGGHVDLLDLRFSGSPPSLVGEFQYSRYVQ